MTDKEHWKNIVQKGTRADGFFDKDELGKEVSFELVAGCLKKASEDWYKKITPAPFFDKLKEYVKNYNYSWHTPGHSSGASFTQSLWIRDFYDFFSQYIFCADLSVSVDELDSLLEPKEPDSDQEKGGPIYEAQKMAARAFGARKTFFVTNGTSTANKIVIQTLVQSGEKLILDRNCHKSVHYAVILSGARPIYLQPSVNQKLGIFGPVPVERIRNAINKHSDAKALILTNCTYDGLIYNLQEIVNYCHKNNIKVIVDEAWFGYAYFHPDLKGHSAMAVGADYATQSTHKVLSAFSQASMIHVNDPEFHRYEDIFKEHFHMHTSTSPQYSMIASLDVARKQMELEGFTLIDRALTISRQLRETINLINSESKRFIALDKDSILEGFTPGIIKRWNIFRPH